jgi:hypothetical protein
LLDLRQREGAWAKSWAVEDSRWPERAGGRLRFTEQVLRPQGGAVLPSQSEQVGAGHDP